MSASPLAGKRIVLGVTGGIAAYKAIELSRRLVDAGAHVVPIMTEAAQHFVGDDDAERAGVRAGADRTVAQPHDHANPAHRGGPGSRPDSWWRRPRRSSLAAYRMGYSHDLLHEHADRDAGAASSSARRCTPKCGSTRVSSTTLTTLRSRGVHVVETRVGPAGRRGRSEQAGWPHPADDRRLQLRTDTRLLPDLAGSDGGRPRPGAPASRSTRSA